METEEKKPELIYDMEATQRIPVGDGVFAVVKPYPVELYKKVRDEFIKMVNESLKRDKDQELTEAEFKQALESDSKLADQLIETLENYPDLPENWKDLLAVEDKQSIIGIAFNFRIVEGKKKLTLGKIVYQTKGKFNGEECYQTHCLRNRTIDDSSRYALISSKVRKPRKDENDPIEVVNQDEAKYQLYLDMLDSVEGFANDKVPMGVGVMIIDDVFAKSIDGKK